MLVPADVAEQPCYDCRIAPGVSKSLHPNFPNVHAGKLTETQRPPTKNIQKSQLKWTKKQNGFVVAFKQQMIILNFVASTVKIYKKPFNHKLMN